MKNWLKYVVILLVFGCKKVENTSTEKMHEIEKISIAQVQEDNNQLKISLSNGTTKTFTLKSEDYELLWSPDSSKLAINERVMSDLQITKVISLDSDQNFTQKNISTQVWQSISQNNAITTEDILFPRTSATQWKSDGTALEVEVTGVTETGTKIDTALTIPLK